MQQDSRSIVLSAVRDMAAPVSEREIEDYLSLRGINLPFATIEAELQAGSVNNDQRLYYSPDISLPPLNNCDRDLFYRLQSGAIELYDPKRHGVWEIYTSDSGRPRVRRRPAYVDTKDQHYEARAHREEFLAPCDERSYPKASCRCIFLETLG